MNSHRQKPALMWASTFGLLAFCSVSVGASWVWWSGSTDRLPAPAVAYIIGRDIAIADALDARESSGLPLCVVLPGASLWRGQALAEFRRIHGAFDRARALSAGSELSSLRSYQGVFQAHHVILLAETGRLQDAWEALDSFQENLGGDFARVLREAYGGVRDPGTHEIVLDSWLADGWARDRVRSRLFEARSESQTAQVARHREANRAKRQLLTAAVANAVKGLILVLGLAALYPAVRSARLRTPFTPPTRAAARAMLLAFSVGIGTRELAHSSWLYSTLPVNWFPGLWPSFSLLGLVAGGVALAKTDPGEFGATLGSLRHPSAADVFSGVCWFSIMRLLAMGFLMSAVALDWTPAWNLPVRFSVLKAPLGISLLEGVSSLLITPVFEEFMFRALLFPSLSRYLGVGPAVFVSGVAFAATHVSSYEALGITWMYGMALALLYSRSRSVAACVIAHSLVNASLYLDVLRWWPW